MTLDLAERAVKVRVGLSLKDQDPLLFWRFAVARVKQALALFAAEDPIDELHLRACNKGTKTETVAAFVLACLQKRRELDGMPLPRWRGPIEAAQLVLDYKQQLLSVQPAYLRLLGDWPHRARWTGEYLSSLEVKPASGDGNWSVVHFLSQENKRSGVGVRADLVAFDEPPVMSILQELRKAPHAGRRGLILIGETPTVRRQWAPLKDDYGDSPRRSIRRVDRERAEVRWSLDEVADWVLSPAEKAKLLRRYQKDPLHSPTASAREHGDYMTTEGTTPWGVEGFETLLGMLDECREPEIVLWRVSREAVDESKTATVVRVPVEVFGNPQPRRPYYGAIDPASGAEGRHNPAGLLLSEVGSGDLQVRWNGYLAPYSLGVLGAGLGRQYHHASMDIEMKDHWGVNVVRGFNASHYGNLAHELRELTPGVWAKEVGWDANEEAVSIGIGCIQEWLAAWHSGIKYARCPSRKVIEALLDCNVDDRGKIVAAQGIDHGEDLRLWGQSLRRCVSRVGRMMPEIYRAPKTAEQELMALIRGEGEEDREAPGIGGLPRLRARNNGPR